MTKRCDYYGLLYICGFKMPVSLITHPANLQCQDLNLEVHAQQVLLSFPEVWSLRAELGKLRKPGGRQLEINCSFKHGKLDSNPLSGRKRAEVEWSPRASGTVWKDGDRQPSYSPTFSEIPDSCQARWKWGRLVRQKFLFHIHAGWRQGCWFPLKHTCHFNCNYLSANSSTDWGGWGKGRMWIYNEVLKRKTKATTAHQIYNQMPTAVTFWDNYWRW